MKISSLKNSQSLNKNFKSNYSSKICNLSPIGSLNHETYLFREPKTDEFVQNYIRTRLLDEPEIALVSGACSSGEEIMSYAIMLDDMPDKLKLSAFDIDSDIVELAKQGKIYVANNSMEGHLLNKMYILKTKQKCAKKFHKHFRSTGVVKPPEIDSYLRGLLILNPAQYSKEIKKLSLREFQLESELFDKIEFKVGDVSDIDSLYKENSVDILLFRNAFYHLICRYDEDDDRVELQNSQEIADSVASKMYKVLKSNGLVVFGENENKQGVKNVTIENAMLKCGFKPVEVEPDELNKTLYTYIDGYCEKNRHYHVWQK